MHGIVKSASTLRRRGIHAFSLIELLVVTAIMGLVVTAIGACLAGGFRLWDAAQHFGRGESDAYFALHVMSRDLRNTFPCYCNRSFDGTRNKVSFPAMVAGTPGEEPDSVGLIEYSFDTRERVLVRRTLKEQEGRAIIEEIAISDVEDFTLIYRDRAEDGSVGAERDSTTNIPFSVDIRLTLDEGDDGKEVLDLHRIVILSAGEGSS